MKRGIFRTRSIDICLDEMVLATPIQPTTLVFEPGEDLLVALPKSVAAGVGEYQFLFKIDDFLDDDPARGESLFQQSSWRYFYSLASATTIEPFSLAQIMVAAGGRANEIWERYHGQTQHHRIIRTIFSEDEPIFWSFIAPGTEPARAAGAVVESNEAVAERRRIRAKSRSEVVKRLRTLDRQHRLQGSGKSYSPGQRQKRHRQFSELLKALYEDHCQVCGLQLQAPDGRTGGVHVHHFEAWDGSRSDRLDNVICVCPNDHARFELGILRRRGVGLEEWVAGSWRDRSFSFDCHLATKLNDGSALLALSKTAI
jgi:hypothetical protein